MTRLILFCLICANLPQILFSCAVTSTAGSSTNIARANAIYRSNAVSNVYRQPFPNRAIVEIDNAKKEADNLVVEDNGELANEIKNKTKLLVTDEEDDKYLGPEISLKKTTTPEPEDFYLDDSSSTTVEPLLSPPLSKIDQIRNEINLINKSRILLDTFHATAQNLYKNEMLKMQINTTTSYGNVVMNKSTKEEKEDDDLLVDNKIDSSESKHYLSKVNKTLVFKGVPIFADKTNSNEIEEESSGDEDIQNEPIILVSTTSTTTDSINAVSKECHDAYVIAITNKPYNAFLVSLHRTEMEHELILLQNYIQKNLSSYGSYQSFPMKYKGRFSQKYIMANPNDCEGLEAFTKKAVSYGAFMEQGIFQCRCGNIKKISKVH